MAPQLSNKYQDDAGMKSKSRQHKNPHLTVLHNEPAHPAAEAAHFMFRTMPVSTCHNLPLENVDRAAQISGNNAKYHGLATNCLEIVLPAPSLLTFFNLISNC